MNIDLLQSFTPEVGAMPYRAYYIPFDKFTNELDKTKSPFVTVLKNWDFEYHPYYTKAVEKETPFRPVTVPHNWQKIGYDYEQYTNVLYPIPYNPPFVDADNPVAVYETIYKVDKKSGRYYLITEGVDSAYFLRVNGVDIGYATGSHLTHEYDLTDVLKEGDNKVRITVFKWCSGTYLECQDKFRLSGIFRDVYILRRPEDHIFDYKITTDYVGKTGYITFKGDKECNLALYYKNKLIGEKTGANVTFTVDGVKLWTAETPDLYELRIERKGEKIVEEVGVRKIEIDGRVFKINGKPVKMRGVNRHSSNVNGYVETLNDILKDLKIMREHNVNAIRTSHYMPHAYLPKLCDRLGLYLILECDIETHGDVMTTDKCSAEKWCRISSNKNYEAAYLDRMHNMYERDKSRASVILWSLGNEANWGNNFIKSTEYLHSVDTRPVHYEGSVHAIGYDWGLEIKELDVYSRMYPDVKTCKALLANEKLTKPFVLCEYSHAMGNSCGDLKDYWDLFYNEEGIFGAFIWEWCDHVIKKGEKMLYGGDSGELIHQGNFCVDGLVDADRKFVHSSLKEAKEVYAPVDLTYDNGVYTVINRYDYISLSKIKCSYRVESDGKPVYAGTLNLGGIRARKSKDFALDFTSLIKGYTTVIFDFILNNKVIATRQVVLSDNYKIARSENAKGVTIVKNADGGAAVTTPDFNITVNRGGMIASIKKGGFEYLKKPSYFSGFRAFVDNDRRYFDLILGQGFNLKTYARGAKFFARDIAIDKNEVTVKGVYSMEALEWKIEAVIKYTFYIDRVAVSLSAENVNDMKDILSRFGFTFPLNDGLRNLTYFGRGTEECYEDKKLLAQVSKYDTTVDDAYVDYCKPQESGAHVNTREAAVFDSDNEFKVYSEKDFSFSVARDDAFNYPAHKYEIIKRKGVFMNVDYRHRGVGSHSCGEELDEKYQINDEHIDFNFDIILK